MASDATLNIVVGGIKYAIAMDELTPRDARDFRQATGTRLVEAIQAPDLDHLAAFIWLQRRRIEPGITLDQVEDNFTLGSVDAAGDEVDDDPEASGANGADTSPASPASTASSPGS